jgi:hypothetical protein
VILSQKHQTIKDNKIQKEGDISIPWDDSFLRRLSEVFYMGRQRPAVRTPPLQKNREPHNGKTALQATRDLMVAEDRQRIIVAMQH